MCEIAFDQFKYRQSRRPSDIARCHAFHVLRTRHSATFRDYQEAVKDSYGGYGQGFFSIIRCLTGNRRRLYDELIVAWRLNGDPIFLDTASSLSFSKTEDFRDKCVELWNESADEDLAVYSPLEGMYSCEICGKQFSPFIKSGSDVKPCYLSSKSPTWSNLPSLKNQTRFNTCMRKSCKKVAEAALKVGNTKTPYRGSKKPYILYILTEAVKNGGNNEIYRWLKKNAFRDAGKVLQRRD